MGNGRLKAEMLSIAALTFLAAFLRFYGLSAQPLSADDHSVGVSAWNYMERGVLGPTMWNHPPLRNILVYLSASAFGEGAWGLKLVSFSLGVLSIPALFLAARRIFGSAKIALLAAFFLAIDPLHVDFSRQAVHEVYMMFFSLAGIYLALTYRDGGKPLWLIVSGAMFGAGLSSKWYVLFPLAATFGLLIHDALTRPAAAKREKYAGLVFISAALIALPLTLYLLAFIPWFQRGYDLADWVALQHSLYAETAAHQGYNPYGFEIDHKAYLWFVKPVAFADFIISGGRPVVLLGISNFLVWLFTLPSIIYIAYKGVREKTAGYNYLLALFAFSYAPLIITSRPIWAHTAFSVIPYAFMAIAYCLHEFIGGKKNGKIIASAYLLAVVLMTCPLYLLAIGKGLEYEWLRPIVLLYKPSYEWNR